ncbi:MAG: tryptophan synthase subunit beta [Acidipropionibacterium jensenii]|nr:tryptophan synthase subunit beta [Acidipropionibacterium jensenii]
MSPSSTSPAPRTPDTGAPAQVPDATGHFGRFGGRFVPEALQAALDQLDRTFEEAMADPAFAPALDALRRNYAGRPSPLTEAHRFAEHCHGARVFLKREDLNHTGSHKINNVLGQALLARRMGKHRLIAETGAGQHGVATATVAAMLGMKCRVYMGKVDTDRQALNVARMQLLGAEVVAVEAGSKTLKDAMNEAMRDWVAHVDDTHYLIGTASGPAPFPKVVKQFQRVISIESREQIEMITGCLPDAICACVGGGSNAIGSFAEYIADPSVKLFGFEAGGEGVATGHHAASITGGSVGVLHGTRTYILQDEDGQTVESHSISAGLDYPGVGPEHSWLARTGRAQYLPIDDDEAMEALRILTESEGIMPAIESAHAVAGAMKISKDLAGRNGNPPVIIITISGRGDKDVDTALKWFGIDGSVDATTGGMK